MEFGKKIKDLRLKMKLTQEELAVRCELSKGFISLVERDLTSPSISTLIDILDCLGTNLKNFFSDEVEDKIVYNHHDIFIQENENLGYHISWLITNAQKNTMEPILLQLQADGKSEHYSPYEGEIFGFVLQGTCLLTVGNRTKKVKKGESFYFKANSDFLICNQSKKIVQILMVSNPPNF